MNLARTIKQPQGANKAFGSVRLFALIVSLLLAQALGFMHGIEHAPHANAYNNHQQAQLHGATPDHHTGWVADLFAGHDEESTCQVFDQLSHGHALLGEAAVVKPDVLTLFFLDAYRGATPLPQCSLIQARGPPARRILGLSILLQV